MNEPLAVKLRPKTIDDIIGQSHLIGENKVISNLINNNHFVSMILYGPPGTGKTSLALSIINTINLNYRLLNAVINNKKDFDIVVEEAKMYKGMVVIMDEIHRLNKDKQDLLLPYLESGLITLIGITTSNPYHSINPAIRSRCQIFELKLLTDDEIIIGLKKAIDSDYLKNIKITDEAINKIATNSNGDLRYAYNLLETAYYSTNDFNITIDTINKLENKKNSFFDKNGDGYYDVISALQKSIRGSDVNAALYYLAILIDAEEYDVIYRRLLVIAYEDISLANPNMGLKVESAIRACERLGFPEARIVLGQIVVEMALSPKSNSSHVALDMALNDIRQGKIESVPDNIKNHPINYLYPHDYPNSWVKQNYMPKKLIGKKYYIPKTTSKYERSLKDIYDKINKLNG